jgi:hypothetical protein
MARDDEAVSKEAKAAVPLVVRGVTKQKIARIASQGMWQRCWDNRHNQRLEGGHRRGLCHIGKVGVG